MNMINFEYAIEQSFHQNLVVSSVRTLGLILHLQAAQCVSRDSSKAFLGAFKEQTAMHKTTLARAESIISNLKDNGASEACISALGAALTCAQNAMNLALESAGHLEESLELKGRVDAVGGEYRIKTNDLNSALQIIQAALAGCMIPPLQLYEEQVCTADTVRAAELELVRVSSMSSFGVAVLCTAWCTLRCYNQKQSHGSRFVLFCFPDVALLMPLLKA